MLSRNLILNEQIHKSIFTRSFKIKDNLDIRTRLHTTKRLYRLTVAFYKLLINSILMLVIKLHNFT
jgi:hypothetical protein